MRIIIIILLFSVKAKATTYYVSNAGSDAASGTTTGTSWQTIGKTNTTVTSNDTVYFKGGDSFTGSKLLIIAKYYGSYGSGRAIITGFQTLGGFSQSGNVWTLSTGINKNINNVLINGLVGIKARSPNSGYATFSSNSGDSSITTTLPNSPSYVGKELVTRTTTWVIDVGIITSQSSGVIKMLPKMTYNPSSFLGSGYFIQNDPSFVDSLQEYSFDSSTGVLKVYSTITPTVLMATRDTLVHFINKAATFTNINLTGANLIAINADTCSGIAITSTTINYPGYFGIKCRKTSNSTFGNDSVLNCLSNGIFMHSDDPNSSMYDTCNNNTLTSIYVKNTALYAGMGIRGDSRYIGVDVVGTGNKLNYITGDSCGYIGILWQGKDTITNCIYKNTSLTKSDGGAFYSWLGVGFPTNFDSGTVIRNCIASVGVGYAPGTTGNVFGVGFYMDDLVKNVTIDSCSAERMTHGMFLHNALAITATNNILDDSLGYPLWISNVATGSIFKYNVYYQRNLSNPAAYFDNASIAITSDSNYYQRPTAPTSLIRIVNTFYNYNTWETHGFTAPSQIISNPATFYYNATSALSATSLSGSYKDGKNLGATNFVNINPFNATILYKANFDGAAPSRYFLIR